MSLDIKQKKSILDFVANFAETARNQKWVSHYDADTDAMVIRSPRLSPDVRKRYLNDEFAFYINGRNKVQGIFIEYFVTNFILHHKDMKNFKREIKKEVKAGKDKGSVVKLKSREARKIMPELENALIESVVLAGK